MKTSWCLLALISIFAVGPTTAGATQPFPAGWTSTSADPGGTAEAHIDQATGKLFVKASVTQDPIPKPQALIADHRQAIAEATLVWRYVPLLDKDVQYFAEVSIEFPSTGPDATFAEDEVLVVPSLDPFNGARGADALVSLEFEPRVINCSDATCGSGDASGTNGYLACSDPKSATGSYWGNSPWDCQQPTAMTMRHSVPLMAHASADYSYLEVEVSLRAIAFLRDWRGRYASAGSGAMIIDLSVSSSSPTDDAHAATADSSDGIASAAPSGSSSPAWTMARPAKTMRARELPASQRYFGKPPGGSSTSKTTREWPISFGLATALATGVTVRRVMRDQRRQGANLT